MSLINVASPRQSVALKLIGKEAAKIMMDFEIVYRNVLNLQMSLPLA